MTPNVRAQLDALLAKRILVLDGAMGTMVQRHQLTEADFRGARFKDHPKDLRGNNDVLVLTRPGRHRRDPPAVPRGRRRHHRDQHLQRHGDRAGGLRARAAGLRAEPRGREAGARGVRRVHREGSVAAALRRRLDGADQPHPVDLARREQPGVPQHDVRRAARRLQGAGARPDRRRLRPAAGRDDRRHAQRQGGDRRDRRALRRTTNPERGTAAADDLGHDHRPQRPHPVGADDRRVLGVDRARQAVQRRHQLRARREGHAPVPRGAGADRQLLRQLLPERRAAERLRRLRRAGRRDRRLPARVRHQRLRQHRRRLLRHDAGSHQVDRRRRRRPAAAGSALSRIRRFIRFTSSRASRR